MEQVLGKMKTREVADYLDKIGDERGADVRNVAMEANMMEAAFGSTKMAKGIGDFYLLKPSDEPGSNPLPKFQPTGHVYGFYPVESTDADSNVPIRGAGNIIPDKTLKGQNIKITLSRIMIQDYPGDGPHQILFDFRGRHQIAGQGQDLRFSQTYRVNEGEGAAVTGYPIFTGLRVGAEGMVFSCSTINVKNEGDHAILGFMEGDVFKKGLELIKTVNPVIPLVSGFAEGITKMLLSRNDNKIVQDFSMGLDFSAVRTTPKLREGTYIAVQTDDKQWDWTKWVYNPKRETIVSAEDPKKTIDWNYILFSISKMEPEIDEAPSTQ